MRSTGTGGDTTFWVIMTIIDVAACIVYFLVAKNVIKISMAPDRRRKFLNSAWLLLAWAAICIGHFMLIKK